MLCSPADTTWQRHVSFDERRKKTAEESSFFRPDNGKHQVTRAGAKPSHTKTANMPAPDDIIRSINASTFLAVVSPSIIILSAGASNFKISLDPLQTTPNHSTLQKPKKQNQFPHFQRISNTKFHFRNLNSYHNDCYKSYNNRLIVYNLKFMYKSQKL